MNLKQFLDYRANCPFCNQLLSINFSFRLNSKSLLTKDYLVLTKPNYIEYDNVFYDINYFLNLTENIFHINYSRENNQVIDKFILKSISNEFIDINSIDTYGHSIVMQCDLCRCYSIITNTFTFDCNNHRLIGKNLYSINRECFYFLNMMLINDINLEISLIKYKEQCIKTNLIKFISAEETLNKLKILILFS